MKKILLLSLLCMAPLSVMATQSQKTLKIVNNNIAAYQWTKKVDILTTRGNATDTCDYQKDNPCIMYKIVNKTGNYGIVLKWTKYEGTENAWPEIFIYDFQKGGVLKSITVSLNKKYHINDLWSYTLIQDGNSIVLKTQINAERFMSPDNAIKYGYSLGDNTGTNEYPVYENVRLIIPVTFFKSLLSK